jgi:hypothetical protein
VAEPIWVRALARADFEQRWTIHLETLQGSLRGERTLDAPTCALATKAAVLVIALAVRPELPLEPPPPPPVFLARAVHVLLRAFSAVDVGVVPSPGLGFGLAAGVRLDAFRIDLRGAYGLNRTNRASGADQAQATIQALVALNLRGCWDVRRDSLDLDACGGVEGAGLRGEGIGISNPLRGSAIWAGVFVGGGIGYRMVGPMFLRLDVDLGVALQRPSFQIDPYGEVFRPAPVYGRLGIGVEVEIP